MKLYVVGFGCGSREGLTLEAEHVLQECDMIVGYTAYVELLKPFFPEKPTFCTGMRKETDRVLEALALAAEGKTVALVCSGDSSVYGMAGLALELSSRFPGVTVQPVAGVTAALSGGAVLGAPLTHDFAVISLSDLLTPWEKIATRLRCAAEADFSIALYNPASKTRTEHLKNACDILLQHKNQDTICGYVRNIGREGTEHHLLTLQELRDTTVDMVTTVFIGNAETKIVNGKMVTPRGYRNV